ncbi:MAG TPA: hypothetical protein VKA09_13655 [Nitrososphaeraceae archaeon]|nr:hypothetical protein [Nitrososphaeraceae archaeon]
MLKSSIPPSKGLLFESILEPPTPAVNDLMTKIEVDEGEIINLRGKRNRVAVGLPYYENLTSRLQALNEKIPYEIKRLMNDYDFHYVRLTCSFLPDNDCIFEWARFGIELNAKPKSEEPSTGLKPIAHYLFPTEVNSEMKYKREMDITPELKLNLFEVVDVGAEASFSESKEYVIYEPQITSFGLNRSEVVWQFKKTKEKGIWGDKSLLVVVRSPKGSEVKGRFLIGAQISSHLSKWVPLPVRNKDERIVDAVYTLFQVIQFEENSR